MPKRNSYKPLTKKGLFFPALFMCCLLPVSDTWFFLLKEIPAVRAHHALIYHAKDKHIFLTGGSTPLDGGRNFEFYNDCWTFSGSGWNKTGNAGDKRSGMGLAYHTQKEKIYSFGGFSGEQSLNDLRVLEGKEWQVISTLPGHPAAEPGFVYDQERDRLIVFGGSAGRGQLNGSTWEWDGKNWKEFKGNNPAPRQAAAMIFDKKRKKTVLFGGMGSSPENIFGDTWEFDGTAWTKMEIPGPSARMSMGFTYDEKNGLFLIFGGAGSSGFSGDTWGYDGKAWRKLSEKGPSPRAMGYMAYDGSRQKTILFGGRQGWPHDMNDTWEWNGIEWTEIK